MTALEMYKQMCPNARLNFFQMDLLENEVTDLDTWKETLRWWFGNGYREQSIFKMIELYNQKLEERNRGRWQDVGKWNGEPANTPPDPNCAVCGQAYCLKEHRDDTTSGTWAS